MDIHKPKPVHNWRDFLKEVGIIVLGVSIALGAEQTVELFHWRAQVTEAREFIAAETARNVNQAIWRMRTATCTERRLDELGAILDMATKTGSLPPVGDFATPPRTTWPTGSWESVVASQTATHFPRQLLADLTVNYKTIARLGDFSAEEISAWNVLYTLVGPGRRLDPASEARLREALSQARSVSRLMAVMSNQLIVRTNTLGLPFTAEDIERIAQGKREPLLAPRGFLAGATAGGAICAPIGKAPLVYGQGIFSASATMVDDAEKNLPDFSKGAR
jgi:hypothetical protein